MIVAAPARLSITSCWPNPSLSRGARIRAMASEPPPGGYGTINYGTINYGTIN